MMLWGGRFSEPSSEDLRRLNDSIGYDQRMYAEDIAGSIAYAEALADSGIITNEESAEIIDGLLQVKGEFDSGDFVYMHGDEDIHTAVERRLTEIVGSVGGKLHTGRSRNDQVATDFRLWMMKANQQITNLLVELQLALVTQAEEHVETLMPGYTHLQPAQPITAAHWLMSFFWMFARDCDRLRESLKRTAVMPLGSGALAGNPFAIDREKMSKRLGFNSHSHNSLDAVSDRDFVIESMSAFALIGVHLSRLGEDLVLYSNPLFGYITLHDRYSTGSSLMPQKRNADPMELARGKSGRLIGHLMGILTTIKGLPSGYNKDLQEDKEAVFDSVDTLSNLLPVITAVIATLKINVEKMKAALTDDLLATDLADYLVRKGVPFREAHHLVGQVVQLGLDANLNLSEIPVEKLRTISDHFEDDVAQVFDFMRSIVQRQAAGGTAPDAVRAQIAEARQILGIN